MVKIIKLSNGIMFDSSVIPGSGEGFAKKMFMPINYPAINNISLYNDRVIGTGALGKQFNLTLNGAEGSHPVSQIGLESALENVTSLEELFNKFITIL
jgi:hypothetical protein